MGVQGLWELLTPVGRRVSVDSLGSRKLAIDASIWIIQFMKAMRDERGDMVRNAHLLGFFRRICKLLYLRIKPVFVFDGGTPALKRRTVMARRRQRENAQSKIRKTAEKLLLNHLRSRKLEEIASDINSVSRKESTHSSAHVLETDVNTTGGGVLQGSDAHLVSERLSFTAKSDLEAADALLAASLAAGYNQNTDDGLGLAEEIIEASDEDDEEEELVMPSTVKGLDPAVLASLPASMQLELLVQMREQLVAENRQKFQKVSKVPSSFSQLQIQAYLKTVAFRREITEVQRAAGGGGVGGVPTTRIASSTDREYIFSNSFQGEKPAPSTIEEQRRAQSIGTEKEIPKSFLGSKSSLFSATTKTLKKSLERIPEEGVISLVSTELNGEPESNSNSSVHTYVDEKGHVRVSRVRGMGVRMTRDLQWNLYLMKDNAARKSLEVGGSSSDPPIIPPNTLAESPSTFNNSHNISENDKGLQISFVDDGNSGFSKDEDGDLFEELVMVDRKDEHTKTFGSSSLAENNANVSVTDLEDEEEFEWEEGSVDRTVNTVHKVDPLPASRLVPISGDQVNGYIVEEEHKEDEDGEDEQWEDGGVDGGIDYGAVEDKDLAEAMRLSLMGHDEVIRVEKPNDHIIIEDGPSSDESEVEWEDGTGAVTVTGFDAVTGMDDGSKIQSGPSEEAQIEEAIRRSLEDFCPPAKSSSRLVIKEPSDDDSRYFPKVAATHFPLVRAEAESEELYLARERTRKGKALLGEEDSGSRQYASNASQMTTLELEKCAEITDSKPTCNEDALETLARVSAKSSTEKEGGVKADEATPAMEPEQSILGQPHVSVTDSGVTSRYHEELAPADIERCISDADNKPSSRLDPGTDSSPLEGKNLGIEQTSGDGAIPNQLTDCRIKINEHGGTVSPKRSYNHIPNKAYVSQSWHDNEAELLREAEELDSAKEREELQLREAHVLLEREQLAKEEMELQAELEAEREEIQAGLDRERELLAQEEMELRASQKKNERNADSVTGEMFSEVQELLQMFGLPYVIAPMEAEAQCAYMDTTQLVDGVITDDSDVFLFGGRNVYKNLFDDRKYVETYYMKDLESEMGMTREKLIRMALLLGSDYTEGISGIGIVNAIEVVNAFEEEDGLQIFKTWLDSPDMSLLNKVRGRAKVKGSWKGGREKGKAADGGGEHIEEDEVSEGGDLDETEDNGFTPRQRDFISKHRAVSKNWNIPDSFPSEAVITAYLSPMVDKSKETFSFGRPDLEALRRFCFERFAWNKDKADELLLPVLKEYDRRETQTRMESFYHFNQRFAKIRSRRIQKAVTGINGRRSDELMELPPHLVTSIPAGKSQKRSKASKTSEGDEETMEPPDNNQEPTLTADRGVTGDLGGVRARRGRGRGRNQSLATAGEVEDEMDGENGEDGLSIPTGRSRGRGRGRGRGSAKVSARGRGKGRGRGSGRGRGRGRSRGVDSEDDASDSDASKSDEVTEDLPGNAETLKRKTSQMSSVARSSTRRRPAVKYQLDNSDEEAGGACSDGEEVQEPFDLDKSDSIKKRKIIDLQIPKASSSSPPEEVVGMDRIETHCAEPSGFHEYADGGGFCREDGEGNEEGGQVHFEMDGPAYLALGGGFCLDEEVAPNDVGSGVTRENGLEQHSNFVMEDGFCLPEDEEEALAKASEIAEENYRNRLSQMEHQESSQKQNVQSPSSSTPVDSDVVQPMKQPGTSDQPVELGLRAMPMMRRKRRKSE